MSGPPADRRRRAALALVLAIGLLYGLRLGERDFWAPDEPRYGAIAEELRSLRHGPSGLVLLHLNDAPYSQKPPLYFWLAALAGAPGGRVDELAARLPSAIAALASVALTCLVGRWLLGDATAALLAAGLLATSFRFAFTARRVQLDALLTLCELVAIALFLWLELRRGGIERARQHPGLLAALHATLGAAALVKGPVGWLPLAVFAAYLTWEGRPRAFRALVPCWGWLLSVAPVLLWSAGAILLAPAGFADRALVENLIARFFAGSSHARPFYYYAYQLPLDFLPWTLLLPAGLLALWRAARRAAGAGAGRDGAAGNGDLPDAVPRQPEGKNAVGRRAAASRFLLAWIALPLAFFTLSAGKRGLYLLPIFPALALAAAAWLAPPCDATGPRAERTRVLLGWAILAVGGLELAIFSFGLPLLEHEKSPRPIAEAAARELAPDEPIGVYRLRPIEGGIGYYGRRAVASLQDEAQLAAFLAAGGRVVVLRGGQLESLAERSGLELVESFRSGRRQIVVARVRAAPPRTHPGSGAGLRTRSRRPPDSGTDSPRPPDVRSFSRSRPATGRSDPLLSERCRSNS